jgi:hypothetical protein
VHICTLCLVTSSTAASSIVQVHRTHDRAFTLRGVRLDWESPRDLDRFGGTSSSHSHGLGVSRGHAAVRGKRRREQQNFGVTRRPLRCVSHPGRGANIGYVSRARASRSGMVNGAHAPYLVVVSESI